MKFPLIFALLSLTIFKAFSQGIHEKYVIHEPSNCYTDRYGNIYKVKENVYCHYHPFRDGLALVQINGKYGYIDTSFNFVISPVYNYATYFSNGLTFVNYCSGWQKCSRYFINKNGKILKTIEFDDARGFSEGLAPVKKNDLWGYLAAPVYSLNKAKLVIDFQYDMARNFSDGLAYVTKKDKRGFINAKGKWQIILPDSMECSDFHDGLCSARNKNTGISGYMNKEGTMTIPSWFNIARDFENGLAVVIFEVDKKAPANKYRNFYYLFLDTKGNFVSDTFRFIEKISDYVYKVRIGNIYTHNYFSVSTRKLLSERLVYDEFSEGLAPVENNGKWGFINLSGELIIPCEYDTVLAHRNGCIPVKKNGKWGFINNYEGKLLETPTTYDSVRPVSEERGLVKSGGYWSFTDRKGNTAIPQKFIQAQSFLKGISFVRDMDTNCYIIDTHGNILRSKVKCKNFLGPVITFRQNTWDYDTIAENTIATCSFVFYNTGDEPLLVMNVQTSCGCLCPSWSREPVLPGDSSEIKLTFNSSGFGGRQFHKSVTVTCNQQEKGQNRMIVLFVKGYVRAGKK